ncbi:hypothetical protein [Marinicellulosiphila megalodicopiae]|uniref:hypothetical protein n=1 Tax=Marinicellulosiphila megalodicopiae TaxID=2724896 RepID=UPI003BB0ECE2
MIKQTDDSHSNWWEQNTLEIGEMCQIQLGDICLKLSRHLNEWHCSYDYSESESDIKFCKMQFEQSQMESNLKRLANVATHGTFMIKPMVSDKPFVIQPTSPIHLFANESTTIYMSSIIWLQICIGESLQEWFSVPVQIPMETWVGENTMVGELCYASKTAGRLQLELLPKRVFRVITPVTIINKGTDILLIDKINLPLPYLSVFSDQFDNFWTESISITRNVNLQAAKLEIENYKKSDTQQLVLVTSPRKSQQSNQFIKTVHQLFG